MKNKLLKASNNNKNSYKFIICAITVIAMIAVLVWFGYKNITEAIIYKQQQHLLNIADTIALSLENFMGEQRKDLKIISENPAFQKKFKAALEDNSINHYSEIIEVYYKTQQNNIEAVELINKKGVILEAQPLSIGNKQKEGQDVSSNLDVNYILNDHKPAVSELYFDKNGDLAINLLEPIFYKNEFQGIIRSKISLNTVYKKFVQPIKAGNYGYASVKDKDGVLIMHPRKIGIGDFVIEARKKEFPDYDWSELAAIVEKQKKGQRGVGIYHSIWATDATFRRVKKFSAYSPAYIGDDFWIVNISMDYAEIADIIKRYLYITLVLASIIMSIFIIGMFYIYRTEEKKNKLEAKAKYVNGVKKLNEELKKDIEQRKILEQELIKNKERFQILFDSGSDCIFVITVDNNNSLRFLEVNDKACSQLGYTKQQVLTMNYWDIDKTMNIDKVEKIKSKLHNNKTILFETTLQAKDKKDIPVEINARLFILENKPKMMLISRDITNRKIQEDALRRSEARFRSIVNQVASEISTKDNLTKYNKFNDNNDLISNNNIDNYQMALKLEKINMKLEKMFKNEMDENKRKEALMIYQSKFAAMGEMIGNIAHQWRQPLSSLGLIISNVEDMYRCDELDKEYLDDLINKARKLINKMSQTIDDFRYFFKPTSDKEVFSIYENVLYTLKLNEEILKFHQIKIAIQSTGDDKAFGYANQFSQVIFNIINNSIDALAESNCKDKKMKIKIYNENNMLITEIIDNGNGIKEELLNKIFNPYFTTKEKKNGTGLGLYMSKMIIEKNFNGNIQSVNLEGGACFKISIPKEGVSLNGKQ